MMNDENHSQAHEEIDLLLPWYVNDTLDPTEHERVARHVAGCPECRQNVSLLSDLQETVVRKTATPIVPQPRVDDLIDSIESRESAGNAQGRSWRPLLAAVAVTIVLTGGLMMIDPDRGADAIRTFETATSNRSAPAMDYVLSIQFSPETSQSERERLLQDIGARDISGGSAEGSYRVVVQLATASLEDLDRYTNHLQSLPQVTSVRVVALQLPMKSEQ